MPIWEVRPNSRLTQRHQPSQMQVEPAFLLIPLSSCFHDRALNGAY